MTEESLSPEVQESHRPYEILRPEVFIESFEHEVAAAQAGDAVGMKTFLAECGTVTDRVREVLIGAARRGVRTSFHLDYLSLASYGEASLRKSREIWPLISGTLNEYGVPWVHQYVGQLEDAGVSVQVTNMYGRRRVFPWTLSDHKKMAYVRTAERSVGWIGGVNLIDRNMPLEDAMMNLTDSRLVTALVDDFLRDKHGGDQIVEDRTERIEGVGALYFDGGKPGRSLIMDRAMALMNGVLPGESIVLVTPYYPLGKVLSALNRAQDRGVSVVVISSGPDRVEGGTSYVFKDVSRTLARKRGARLDLQSHPRYIHSKVLIAGNTALFGSHNFSGLGVSLGNKEVALESRNPACFAEVRSYTDRLLRECRC